MKLGLSNWGMPGVKFDAVCSFAASTGFAGVELTVLPAWATRIEDLDPTAVGKIATLLDDLGLGLPAIAAHSPLIGVDYRVLQAGCERIRKAIELSVALDRPSHPAINTTVGGDPGNWEDDRQKILERLGPLLESARSAGVAIALEPHVGSALHLPEQTAWVLDQLGRECLGVNFDFSHFLAQGLPLDRAVELLGPDTIHTHLKGVRGRWPDHQFLVPGEDDYDYATELKLMAAAGYRGYQTLEVSVMVQARPDYDPFASARLGYAVLTRAFAAAGVGG